VKMTAAQIISKQEKLKADRGVLDTHLQEIAEYVMPRKNQFLRTNVAGEKKGIELYDNTAMVSCDVLASSLHGTLTNSATMWFEIAAGREEINNLEPVREYLQDLTKRAHRILNNSNFQSEIHEYYLDLCAFGTGVMTVEKDPDTLVRFSVKHLSEIFIAENARGFIEEVYRCFQWEAKQIVEQFASGVNVENKAQVEALVGRDVAGCFYKNDSQKFEIIHCVYRDTFEQDFAMPYSSVYVLKKDKKVLSEGKFRRFPYLVSRWTKLSGEVYGRSPAMNALPEAKTLNMMAKTMIKGAQKVVDPPVQLPDDGFVRPLRTYPGGVNYYRAGSTDRAEPIFNDSRIDFGFEAMRERQMRVQQAFYIDRLNLANNDRMTTVEVNQRVQEQMRFLGPVLGRQEPEFLRPLLDRVLDIMIEEDGGTGEVIGFAPPELQEIDLDVRYSSPIARAQRAQEASALQAALQASIGAIQLDSTASDIINSEMIVRENFAIYGAPQKVLRRRAEVEAIREARQEAMEKAAANQDAMDGAETANKLAPLLEV